MNKLKVSPNRKADHTVAGEIAMDVRGLLEEELSIQQRLDAYKAGNTALSNRIKMRAEERKDALAQIQLDEHNRRFDRNIKIANLELKDFDD